MNHKTVNSPFNIIVIVAALGYFVDIYDLILFGIVMKPSLVAIGIPEDQMFDVGGSLLGMQMIGMLVGGIVWGILGDKKGRLSTLFLTILLYSIANIANGFIQNVEQYKIMRFIAGFGLAGELGIGITLVSEVMTKEARGLGTSIVAGIGILGAVLGFLVADLFDWRMAYWVGGGLGLLLLIMRISVYESGMFEKIKEEKIRRGNFMMLLASAKNFKKYLLCICVGIPVWYVISQLTVQSAAYAKELGVTGAVSGGKSVMFHYIGASLGSLLFGFLSQRLKSRKKALMTAASSMGVLVIVYFFVKGMSPTAFYLIIGLIGIPMGGLWTVFMANASEQFGTNIRSTVTTSAPNFVRGTTELIRLAIIPIKMSIGLWTAGLIIGSLVLVISIVAIFLSEETYGKDLDYTESA